MLGVVAGLAVGATAAIRIVRMDRPAPAIAVPAAAAEPARVEVRPAIEPPGPAGPSWRVEVPDEPDHGGAAPSAPAATAIAVNDDAEEARRVEESRAQLEAERLASARRRVSITMYTTSWCPHCTRAKDWMRANAVPYIERNVEDNPISRDALRRLNPRGSVPTFAVDDEVLVGFSPAALDAAIATAARRRVR